MKFLILFFLLFTSVYSQIKFDDYFLDKTLRVDYFHSGDGVYEYYSIDELKEEPYWGGSKINLIDPFNFGQYFFQVFDIKTGQLIFSNGYATLFKEWQTTEEAKRTSRTFNESIIFPFPKNTVRIEFYSRDKKNNPIKQFEYFVDPKNYFISKERKKIYPVFEVLKSGEPENKVDIVILPEGYTKEEMELFKKDCKKFSDYLFNSSPYKENKDKFNIYGVEAPSEESGTDIPAKNIWKNTLLSTTFYTFDVERYLMTPDFKSVRDVAANAPYDQIYILVNTTIYGGGSIYNFYSVCVNNNKYEEYIFVHEFGHGFASLADEYFTSDVAYENFYDLNVEPLDANLTTLVNFDSKWKDLVDKNTPIPTPDAAEYKDKAGAFEGGGYVSKGVYRPESDCTMKSISVDNFCEVCKRTITEMINFYSE